MDKLPLTAEAIEKLNALAEESNSRLEATAAASSSQAFNLGCSVGLMPGTIIVALVFFLSKGSIAATAIAILLVTMLLILLANIVAYIARKNVIDRHYQEVITVDIARTLGDEMLTRQDFNQVASQQLPQDAALQKFLAEKNQ